MSEAAKPFVHDERWLSCDECGCPRCMHFTEEESDNGPGCNTDEGDCECEGFKEGSGIYICDWTDEKHDAGCGEPATLHHSRCLRHQGDVPGPLTSNECACPWCGYIIVDPLDTLTATPPRQRKTPPHAWCQGCGEEYEVAISFTTWPLATGSAT